MKIEAKQRNEISPELVGMAGLSTMLGMSSRTIKRNLMGKANFPRRLKVGLSDRWEVRAIREWIEGGCTLDA